MLILIAAAAVAAAHPAPAPDAHGQMPMMQMGRAGEHAMTKGMDCCRHCCENMTGKHARHKAR